MLPCRVASHGAVCIFAFWSLQQSFVYTFFAHEFFANRPFATTVNVHYHDEVSIGGFCCELDCTFTRVVMLSANDVSLGIWIEQKDTLGGWNLLSLSHASLLLVSRMLEVHCSPWLDSFSVILLLGLRLVLK